MNEIFDKEWHSLMNNRMRGSRYIGKKFWRAAIKYVLDNFHVDEDWLLRWELGDEE